ncbi:unnamed protein product, partial [Bemisia tabaci]
GYSLCFFGILHEWLEQFDRADWNINIYRNHFFSTEKFYSNLATSIVQLLHVSQFKKSQGNKMYHRSDLASKLILISLISVLFSACESLQTRQRRATTQEELDSHCPADFGKQEITSWKNDCNDCFCIDIMKAACTRMKCTGEHYAVSLGAEEQKLIPDV